MNAELDLDTQQRVQLWAQSCRRTAAGSRTSALEEFEKSVRDMAAGGFALPKPVVDGVRAELKNG